MKKITLLLVALLFSQWAVAYSRTVEVSAAQVQQKIASVMPLSKEKFYVKVTLNNPLVHFSQGSVGVLIDVDVALPGDINSSGQAVVSSSVHYDSVKETIFLEDPQLIALQMNDFAIEDIPLVKELFQTIIGDALAAQPLYKMSKNITKEQRAKVAVKSLVISGDKMVATVEY